jgi:hypothetical protein
LIAMAGCSEKTSAQPGPSDGAQPTEPPKDGVRRGLGHQCVPYDLMRATGPIIYRVADVGRRGVPKLDKHERDEIRTISKFVRSRYLRFAVLGGDVVVFNAFRGDCVYDAPGYPVLNGACNEYYQPGLDPNVTHPMPGCLGPPRPWVASDKGLPGDPSFWRNGGAPH